ncbi:putative PAS/PAC sensor protein [Halothece sp. PCC 7418]|uniref:PAS domain S-box protein n=1 Tax=Halothece sp. (strain PCC 7418) TaxID=65093 RepID=UPI0002A08D63|nr:PAS domain S-box protein [Halothece sp. PCC 7418]AFZ45501.1 putative PAS/PAC sensor protein [Halothece sp. PCC 7418]
MSISRTSNPPRHLNVESTLQELTLDDFSVDINSPGSALTKAFEENPVLTGVLLMENGQYYGMLSRQKFLEAMSTPYGLELFTRRPLKILYDSIYDRSSGRSPYILPGNTSIHDAAEYCLQRPPEDLYEPLVIEIDPGVYRILDFPQLLLAQGQIYKIAKELLDERNVELNKANLSIREKNQEMSRYLQHVKRVTAAAAAVEDNSFRSKSLDGVAARNDELGRLARVFQRMVHTVQTREKDLADAKEQLETVIDTVPGAISWLNSGGIYLGVNRHLAEDWNLKQDSFIGREVGFLEGSSQLADFTRRFLDSDTESASKEIELQVDERSRYYLVAAQKYKDGSATVSVGIDITERKQAEESLRIAEEKFRSIFENALEGIFQVNLEGQYMSVNPAMANIFGYSSPEEMIEQVTDVSELYVDPNNEKEFHRRINEEGEIKHWEYQVYRQDGSIVWVQEDTRVVKDRHNNVLYYEGMLQEISERKREEEALKRQVEDLKIEIDQQKRSRQVEEITQTEYFQELEMAVEELRFDFDEDD